MRLLLEWKRRIGCFAIYIVLIAPAAGSDEQAPSEVAKSAYDYLKTNIHQTDNILANFYFRSYDNNVCHIQYVFVEGDVVNLKYRFQAQDIDVESIEPSQSDWPGVEFDASSGKSFRSYNSTVVSIPIEPAPTKLRLLMIQKPNDAVFRALAKLALECGAKTLPF